MKRIKWWFCHTLGFHYNRKVEVGGWCSWGEHWIEDDPTGDRSY